MKLTRPELAQTPVELVNGRYYKRDDLLAFDNGVSGKVRTSLYLARQARDAGKGLVYGGSVLAPALGRVASAAAYYDLPCKIVIGSDPVKAAAKHPTVQVVVEAGAELVHSSVAYNPVLQARAREIAETGEYLQVPYGVSTVPDATEDEIRAFLEVDAPQVDSIPRGVENLVVSFGSGNAASGILYGLATGSPLDVERVVLVGVGPDKSAWLLDRLARVGITQEDLPELKFLPLHPHFAVYADQMPETQDGITFHPTYEGKVVRFLDALEPDWWTARDETTCFWIVGGPLP